MQRFSVLLAFSDCEISKEIFYKKYPNFISDLCGGSKTYKRMLKYFYFQKNIYS